MTKTTQEKILRFSLDCEETAGNNVWKHRSEGPTDGGNLKWSGLGTSKRVEQTRAEEYCKLVGGNAWMNNRKKGEGKVFAISDSNLCKN